MVDRAHLLEFFMEAATLLNFDKERVRAFMTEPWEREFNEMQ